MTDQTSPEGRIDSFGPLPIIAPRTVAELSGLVRRARDQEQAVYPIGGGTALDLGLPPTRNGVGIALHHLGAVIDYPTRDMTITVQAGITLARLQELLRAENQRLPVDVPQPEQATLGGALAANVSGPRRFGFGTFRDYVIGISVVNDEGLEVKAGGRVVKNVAGYDLCKLYIGSLGTLGIITQVTLKLRPLPEDRALVLCGCETAALGALLDRLHESRTRPVCLELLNQPAVRSLVAMTQTALPGAPWMAAVGFEDNQQAVAWQVQQLTAELKTVAGLVPQTLRGPDSDPLWRGLSELAVQAQALLRFEANLLPHATADFCRQAAALPDGLLLQAHAGNGIVIGHVPGDLTLERAQALLAPLQTAATAAQGNLVISRCPSAWKATLPIWGVPRADLWLMRTIKDKLDPHRLFNPGRFVDGIRERLPPHG